MRRILWAAFVFALIQNSYGQTVTTNYVSKFFNSSGVMTNSTIFDNGTNVGIGTPTPYFKFQVAHGIGQNFGVSGIGVNNGVTLQSINDANTGHLPLDISASKISLQGYSGGYVGIGTTAPFAKLHVSQSGSGWNDGIRLANGANDWVIISDGGPATKWLTLAPVGDYSKGIVIKDGNVGIGTTSVFEKLHVNNGAILAGTAASTSGGLILAGNYDGANNYLTTFGTQYSWGGPVIGYAVKPRTGASGYVSSTNINIPRSALDLNSDISFLSAATQTVAVDNTVAMSTNMIIKNNGYVGIGTPSPGQKLDVNGNIKVPTTNQLLFGAAYITGFTQSNYDGLKFYGKGGGSDKLAVTINPGGDVVIGQQAAIPSGYALSVWGKFRANEVVVNTDGGADFVFEDDYNLRPLEEVDKFVKENKHLPEIPSAKEMQENGIGVSELQTKLLQKIEELTLYVIEQNKELTTLKNENKELKQKMTAVEQQLQTGSEQ